MKIDEKSLVFGPGGSFYADVLHVGPYSLRATIRRPAGIAASAEVEVWTDLAGWKEVWSDTQPDKGTMDQVLTRMVRRACDVLQISAP